MSIEGCPLTMYWSDTRLFEVTNISDGQLQGGMSSDNVYAYLYDSGMLSRKPSQLYIAYVDSQGTGTHQIAFIPPQASLQDFEDFLTDVNFTDGPLTPGKPTPFLMLIDAPFDVHKAFVAVSLVCIAVLFRLWPLLLVSVLLGSTLRFKGHIETIYLASYRYRMAKLAKLSVHPLKMNYAF